MSRKPDLLDAAERHAKALLLKSKDVSLDEQIDALRVVTFFIATKNKVRPDKEEGDWLSDAQRRLRPGDNAADGSSSTKPNGAKAQRRAGRDAYLAASRAAAEAANGNGERGHLSFTADGVTTDITELANAPADDSDEDNDTED